MEAAERIFNGSFDHIVDDDGDVEMAPVQRPPPKPRMIVSGVCISVTLSAYIDPCRPPPMMRTKMKHQTMGMRMETVCAMNPPANMPLYTA